MNHILSVLVENKPSVLSRVTGLISRRGFNIESLTVAPTEDATMSRMTIIVKADAVAFEQLTKQLHKLISVYKIADLTEGDAIQRELALFKVSVAPEKRHEIIEIANVFRANILDVGRASMTVEATGDESKLSAMEDLFRAYGIKHDGMPKDTRTLSCEEHARDGAGVQRADVEAESRGDSRDLLRLLRSSLPVQKRDGRHLPVPVPLQKIREFRRPLRARREEDKGSALRLIEVVDRPVLHKEEEEGQDGEEEQKRADKIISRLRDTVLLEQQDRGPDPGQGDRRSQTLPKAPPETDPLKGIGPVIKAKAHRGKSREAQRPQGIAKDIFLQKLRRQLILTEQIKG